MEIQVGQSKIIRGMIYTKEEFKKLWEANEYGSGITFDDIADCAKAWRLFTMPKCSSIDLVTYKVLCAAECSDAEECNYK